MFHNSWKDPLFYIFSIFWILEYGNKIFFWITFEFYISFCSYMSSSWFVCKKGKLTKKFSFCEHSNYLSMMNYFNCSFANQINVVILRSLFDYETSNGRVDLFSTLLKVGADIFIVSIEMIYLSWKFHIFLITW